MSYITPRAISGAEFEVVKTVLLRAATPHTPEFTPDELKSLVVYSKCDCGCSSVGFLPESTKANESTELIADGLGLSPDNKQVGVIVYGSPGQFVELELHWPYEGGAHLPQPETIVPWERGREGPPASCACRFPSRLRRYGGPSRQTLGLSMLMKVFKFAFLVIVVALLFPLYGPTNGVSLNRTFLIVTQEGEHGEQRTIQLQADVFRGLWFSPEGSVIRKTYDEALLITGEGISDSVEGRTGKLYRVGDSIRSVGTGYYDTGTVFVSNDMNTVRVDISKNWNGSLAPAYVNGTYQKKP